MINNQPQEAVSQSYRDYEVERIEKLRRGRSLLLYHVLPSVGIGPRYQEYTFANCVDTDTNRAAVRAAKDFTQALLSGGEASGLYFGGSAGTGKTFLAVAVAITLIRRYKQDESTLISYAHGFPHPCPAKLSPVRFYND